MSGVPDRIDIDGHRYIRADALHRFTDLRVMGLDVSQIRALLVHYRETTGKDFPPPTSKE